MLSEDTLENRRFWLEQSLNNLANYLTEHTGDHPVSKRILIEGEMLTDKYDAPKSGGGTSDSERWRAVAQFTWSMSNLGLTTTVVWRDAPVHDVGGEVGTLLPFPGLDGKV